MKTTVHLLLGCLSLAAGNRAFGQVERSAAAVYLAFEPVLEFTNAAQQMIDLSYSNSLDTATAATIGGWFFPRRNGEQVFFGRGLPYTGAQGERFFPRTAEWVSFFLGSDQRGFLMGALNGNGTMPFPRVTLSELQFDAWNQVVLVKDSRGVQKFYHNGVLVHTDEHATTRGKAWPFTDAARGEPLRLSMPLGGALGEVWIFRRELTAREIADDFSGKTSRYVPALPVSAVRIREMNSHPRASLWKQPVTRSEWVNTRATIESDAFRVLGSFPTNKVALEPAWGDEQDCGTYVRRRVSIQVEHGDPMPSYVLVPKNPRGKIPAVICFYGTSAGAGKDTTVGLSGLKPGTPPQRNFAFAIDIAEAGMVAFAPDYLRDGERVSPGKQPYDTTEFYEKHPDWSIHGKDVWDTSRAIDFLQTLDFVDPQRIGMIGHSYGGHSTIFTAALEPRIKVAVANGPVSDFLHHGHHWGVPKGAGNSQSMPALRPYVFDHTLPLPITFYEFTALIAPRPLLVGQAVGERRPNEEENHWAVSQVYEALGARDRVRYIWYAGDHDFPPEARAEAVQFFRKWFTAE